MFRSGVIVGSLFLMLLAGCQQSSNDVPAKKEDKEASRARLQQVFAAVDAEHAKAAKILEKTEGLDDFLKRIEDYGSNVDGLQEKFDALTPAEQREVLDKIAAKLREAYDAFHERMIKKGPHPQVVIDTSLGAIKVELYEALAPITVKNFLRYTDDKFFDGTIFHRVMPTFMIQGGGFLPGMKEKKDTYASIKNESFNRFSNARGTIAMARTPDPNSATAQFYINVANNKMLDRGSAEDGHGYAVFGRVIEGMDVVDQIKNVPTATRDGHENVPKQDVAIRSVRRVEK